MSAEEAQRYLDTLDSTLGAAGRRLRDLTTRHDFTAAQLQEHQQQQKTVCACKPPPFPLPLQGSLDCVLAHL